MTPPPPRSIVHPGNAYDALRDELDARDELARRNYLRHAVGRENLSMDDLRREAEQGEAGEDIGKEAREGGE